MRYITFRMDRQKRTAQGERLVQYLREFRQLLRASLVSSSLWNQPSEELPWPVPLREGYDTSYDMTYNVQTKGDFEMFNRLTGRVI